MKRKTTVLLFLCLVLLLVLSGCSNKTPEVSKGTISITVEESIAKGIAPFISLNTEYYIIDGIGPGNEKISVRLNSGKNSCILESVVVGNWTITATAYNDKDIEIGSGSAFVSVKTNNNANAEISIKESEGNGTFSVILNGLIDMDDSYVLKLKKIKNGAFSEVWSKIQFTNHNGVLSVSESLENGFYLFEIASEDSLVKLPPIEVIRILKGDVITAIYTQEENKLIKNVMNEAIPAPLMALDISTKQATIEATAVVSNVDASGFSYKWYLNGEDLSLSTKSIKISKNSMPYEDNTLTCKITDSTTGLTWRLTEIFNNRHPYLTIDENGHVSCIDKNVVNVVIPASIDGISVKAIAFSAFKDCTSLKSVQIPNNIETIETLSFYNCTSLSEINIPDSVTKIGFHAFEGCAACENIEFPANCTEYVCLGNCSENILIPSDFTSIGESAFFGCRNTLKRITIPSCISYVGINAFNKCSPLEYIYIDKPEGTLDINSAAIPSDVEIVWQPSYLSVSNEGAVSCIDKTIEKAIIPEYIDGIRVVSIDSFKDCTSLTEVVIPDSVATINDGAFFGCSKLSSVTLSKNITYLGLAAFHGCSSLTTITIHEGVTTINEKAFRGCSSLSSVYMGSNVSSICNSAFENCNSLVVMDGPNNLTYIGPHAFLNCPIANEITIPEEQTELVCIGDCKSHVEIPSKFTSIGEFAFDECFELETISIPDTIKSIGNFAFEESSLTTIEIPDSISSIGKFTFYLCSNLKSITIGNNVTSIDYFAFSECSSLTEIRIPSSVTYIGSSAFEGCSSLKNIYIAKQKDSLDLSYARIPAEATIRWTGGI